MVQLEVEDWGPRGDESRHLPLATLTAGLARLPKPSTGRGRVVLIVRRRADGVRETPDRVELSCEEGVPGDGWTRRPPRDPEAQLAVIRADIAELVANGQAPSLSGDNLYVELDLSVANLPTGSRLRVGQALVEVTPMPHDGCSKFRQRFGADALRFVQARETRDENRRGVYWKVVEPGAVAAGDPIEVVSRGRA